MDVLIQWLEALQQALAFPVIQVGDTKITVLTIVYLAGLYLLLVFLSSKLRHWLVHRLLARSKFELGAREAVGSLVQYVFLAAGLIVILQTSGVDLTILSVFAGTVSIGLGFGLQNIASNFISGIIILLEQPIKVGDRIEVESVSGDVIKINARSTTVLTNDNISIIVPNQKFVTENVINWSHSDQIVRFRIPVGVAYGSDIRLVEKLLLDVARENRDVLDNPKPAVRLMAFGDNGIEFELRIWNTSLIRRPDELISNLNFAISDAFKAHNIEIPFPQRDIYLRSGPVETRSVP